MYRSHLFGPARSVSLINSNRVAGASANSMSHDHCWQVRSGCVLSSRNPTTERDFFCRCTTCFHFFLSADAWCCRPRRSGWFGFDWVGNCIFAKKILCAGHTITDTTWWSKNGTFLYTLTSWNIDRFSNFFNITWTILQLCEHHSIIYYCKVIAECFVVRAQELWNKSILFPDGLS